MKAILEMDMPKTCWECKLSYYERSRREVLCLPLSKLIPRHEAVIKICLDCPLKPIADVGKEGISNDKRQADNSIRQI